MEAVRTGKKREEKKERKKVTFFVLPSARPENGGITSVVWMKGWVSFLHGSMDGDFFLHSHLTKNETLPTMISGQPKHYLLYGVLSYIWMYVCRRVGRELCLIRFSFFSSDFPLSFCRIMLEDRYGVV